MKLDIDLSKKEWKQWLVIFLPTLFFAKIAAIYFGFNIVISALMIFLILTIGYQRYGKRRSWRSILWGDKNNPIS